MSGRKPPNRTAGVSVAPGVSGRMSNVRIIGFDDGVRQEGAPRSTTKKGKPMPKGTARPRLDIEGCDFSNNRRHGINVGKGADADVTIKGTTAKNNGESGLNISGDESTEDPDRPWYQRPVGTVVLLVIAGLIVAYLAYQFGLVPA